MATALHTTKMGREPSAGPGRPAEGFDRSRGWTPGVQPQILAVGRAATIIEPRLNPEAQPLNRRF